MTTSYPGGLDALTNPATGDPLSSPSHAGQHANANDAIEAIEAELGTNPSSSESTVAARLTAIEAAAGGAPLLPLDASAAAAIGSGDDFSGTTLDGGWSDLQTTAITTDASVDGFLKMSRTGTVDTQWRGLKRTFSPSGDFTIWAKVNWAVFDAGSNYVGFGIFAGETDPSDAGGADRIQLGIYQDSGHPVLEFTKRLAGSSTGIISANVKDIPIYLSETADRFPLWLALRRIGSDLSVGLSRDGAFWRWHTTTSTISWTVNTCGLIVLKQSSGNDIDITFDYIATVG